MRIIALGVAVKVTGRALDEEESEWGRLGEPSVLQGGLLYVLHLPHDLQRGQHLKDGQWALEAKSCSDFAEF